MKKALIIRNGSLGDVLLTLQVAESLKLNGFSVEFCLRSSTLKFLKDIGYGKGIVCLDSPRLLGLYTKNGEVDDELKYYLSSFNLILSYTEPSELFSKNLKKICREKVIFFPSPTESIKKNVNDHLLEPLIEREFKIKKNIRIKVNPLRIASIVIHPGSGDLKKNWPFERYLSFARWLKRRGEKVAILLGEAEEKSFKEWKKFEGDNLTVLMNKPLFYISSVIAGSRLYIGNDSGITHLSAALGTKTIAIFGPTDPNIWAPRRDNVIILYKKVSCSPCKREKRRKCNQQRCLEAIGVDELKERMISKQL